MIGGHAGIVGTGVRRCARVLGTSPCGPGYTPSSLMQSTVEALDGNKVKLHVTVPADEFERAIDAAFKKLAREVRVPGLPAGQGAAPTARGPLRFRDRARAGAARLAARVLRRSRRGQRRRRDRRRRRSRSRRVRKTGDVEFEAVVEVRPHVRLVGYDELTRRAALRARSTTPQSTSRSTRSANASPISPTPSTRSSTTRTPRSTSPARSTASRSRASPRATSCTASVPAWSCPSSTSSCAAPGPARSSSSPRRCPSASASAPAKKSTFRVLVKEAKQKVLPDLTDEWVDEASEFDTVDELRADIRTPARDDAEAASADGGARQGARSRGGSRADRSARSRSSRTRRGGVSKTSRTGSRTRRSSLEQYLAATGQEPEAFIDEVRKGAGAAVLADLALRAVIAQEAIEATDDEVDAEIAAPRRTARAEARTRAARPRKARRVGGGTL